MYPSFDCSHIWIGVFNSDAPEDYFVDQDRGDELPFNQFASEQGEDCFDFDCVEISFLDDPQDAADFIDGHSWSEKYLDEVVAAAKKLGMSKINVFVLAASTEFKSPNSVNGDGYRLEYVGKFACDK